MILNILLIVGGLIAILTTGVFLLGLARAPLGTEDETGFHPVEAGRVASAVKVSASDAGTFSHAAANAPLSAL